MIDQVAGLAALNQATCLSNMLTCSSVRKIKSHLECMMSSRDYMIQTEYTLLLFM
jgi:hypothetical protein